MKTSLFSLAAIFLIASSSQSQNINYGGQSEASRFLTNFKRNATSAAIKQDIVRNATQVRAGLGVTPVQAPSGPSGFGSSANTPPRTITPPRAITPPHTITPPRSQSATFGVGSSQPTAKPFAHVDTTPTISPYLGLFDEGFGLYQDLDYQTIVRPAIQQRQFNEQVMRQAQTMNRRLSSLSARNAFNTTGNQQIAPTGHAATFRNLSRFYGQTRSRR